MAHVFSLVAAVSYRRIFSLSLSLLHTQIPSTGSTSRISSLRTCIHGPYFTGLTPPPSPSPESTTSSSTAPSAPIPSSTSTASSTPLSLFPGLILRFRRVVDQQGVERERVREDEVTDGGAADVDGVERDGVAVAERHLDRAQRRVHLNVDREDGAVDCCAC